MGSVRKGKKIYRKGKNKEHKQFATRLTIAFIIVSLVLIALTAYIFHIGESSRNKMTISLLDQARYKSLTIPARRGDIVDARGVLLATSIKTYDIAIDIKNIRSFIPREQQEEALNNRGVSEILDTTVKALADSFNLNEDEILDIIKEKPDSRYYVLVKNVNQNQKDNFESLYTLNEFEIAKIYAEKDEESAKQEIKNLRLEKSKMKDLIKGVIIETRYSRHYPYGDTASSLIGFCNSQSIGQTGVEKYYDTNLQGKDGKVYTYMDSSMMPVDKEISAEDGDLIQLTMDIRYQKVVEKYLKEFKRTHEVGGGEFGAKNIAVVVMDPKDASIKAMASNMGYDLNNPRNLRKNTNLSDKEIENMTDDQISKRLSELWKNYCVSEAYEPGSTFKPLLLAYALDSGAISYRSSFECKGHLKVGDRDIRCSSRVGHGIQNIKDALSNSCNVAFMQIGFRVKKEGLEACQNLFNFGLKTNIDLPDEVYTYNSIHRADNMNIADLATNSFGQNFDVSMIQMISAFSSLINGGTYYRPRVVESITNTLNNTTVENKPIVMRRTVSSNVSKSIRDYLYYTVFSRESDGEKEDTKRIEIGGKTGTAEKLPRDKSHYLISFIGFTPIEEPKLVCYVVIDEPNVPKQDNSKIAMELGKEIIRDLAKIK